MHGLKVDVRDSNGPIKKVELVFLSSEISAGDTFEVKALGGIKRVHGKVLKVEKTPVLTTKIKAPPPQATLPTEPQPPPNTTSWVSDPSDPNNVKIEKKLSDDCSWPMDEKELTNQEEKDVEQLYGCFKDSLLKVKSRTELNDFMLLNKRYITELFETRLYTIRTQLLIGKLRSAAKAISVVNAFSFSKKSS